MAVLDNPSPLDAIEETHKRTLAVSTRRGRHTLPLAGWTSTHAVSKCERGEEENEEEEERDTRLIMIISKYPFFYPNPPEHPSQSEREMLSSL